MRTVKPIRKRLRELLKVRQDCLVKKFLKTCELEKELCKELAAMGYGKGAVLKNLRTPTKQEIKDEIEPWKTLTVISYHIDHLNDVRIYLNVYCKLKYKDYTEKEALSITSAREWFFKKHELIKPSNKFKGLFGNQDFIDDPRLFGEIDENSA